MAGTAMAAGIWGGLARLGLPVSAGEHFAALHGPLMVCAVFGTLIALERAIALGRGWALLSPAGSLFGFAALSFGAPLDFGATAFALAAAVLLGASVVIAQQQRALFTLLLAAGAACLLAGDVLLLGGGDVPSVVGWWIGFLVVTITAERLELARFVRISRRAQAALVASLGFVLAGAALGLGSDWGQPAMGVGLVLVSAWLLVNDVARRTVRNAGATRFIALAMLAGYGWMAVSGALFLAGSGFAYQYDLALHALFLGFVLSMVFGHALMVVPAVTGWKLRYTPSLNIALTLLHLSVAMRVVGGLLEAEPLRIMSGFVTIAALLSFAALLTAAGISQARRRRA